VTAFASTSAQRAEVVSAARVLSHFKIVEAFGHVSVRLAQARILMTPRKALALISEAELVELDLDGNLMAGEASAPLEAAMHLAVYRHRSDVMAIARGHPRGVAAYACAGKPLQVAHGFGANLGTRVEVFPTPYLVSTRELAEGVAHALGGGSAVILQSNGMLAVGQSVPHACVQALFLEEMAQIQLVAQAAGFAPRFYAPAEAERRHGDDRVHEPLRAWEYYLAMAGA
jgi:ribulose-5-phosphate 4-epimerase/fuculose-1-phosphate aldolase